MLLSINGQVMHPPADKFSWRGMTHRKEKSAYREKKKLLTVQRKKCLPRRENFAYQAEKKLLTAGCKISFTAHNSIIWTVGFSRSFLSLFASIRRVPSG